MLRANGGGARKASGLTFATFIQCRMSLRKSLRKWLFEHQNFQPTSTTVITDRRTPTYAMSAGSSQRRERCRRTQRRGDGTSQVARKSGEGR